MTPRNPDAARPPLLAKLKPGPSQPPDEVRASQRARLRRAMVELVADRGLTAVTVRGLSRTSGVSTRGFYAQFANVEECFASTYRTIMHRLTEHLAATMVATAEWREGLRAGIKALMHSVADHPKVASLALVDCYDGSPAMLREIAAATDELERRLGPVQSPLPTSLNPGIVAGVERVVRTRVLAGRQAELVEVADEVSDWVIAICESPPSGDRGPETLLPAPERRLRRSRTDHGDPALGVFGAIGGERGRLLAAVARLGADGGYWKLTAPGLRREAGVSKRRFDKLFGDVDECFLSAVETLATAAGRIAVETSNAPYRRTADVERIVARFNEEIARSSLFAHLCFVDVFAPGRRGLLCREGLLQTGAAWARASVPSLHLNEVTAEALIAACWRTVQADVVAGDGSRSREAALLVTHLITPRRAVEACADSR